MTNLRNGSKEGFECGLTRLRVRILPFSVTKQHKVKVKLGIKSFGTCHKRSTFEKHSLDKFLHDFRVHFGIGDKPSMNE